MPEHRMLVFGGLAWTLSCSAGPTEVEEPAPPASDSAEAICPASEAASCEDYEDDVFLCEHWLQRCRILELCSAPSQSLSECVATQVQARSDCELRDWPKDHCERSQCAEEFGEIVDQIASGELACEDYSSLDIPDSCSSAQADWTDCQPP